MTLSSNVPSCIIKNYYNPSHAMGQSKGGPISLIMGLADDAEIMGALMVFNSGGLV